MTDITNEQIYTGTTDSPSVGERLRLAREDKKITIAEVAAQLRLTKDNVAYLETDQWDKLHGRPYARGYFSNYVNFLGLPHNEMLALFNLEYTTADPSMDGFKRPENNNGFPVVAVSLLIIIAVVAWFAYQYWLEIQTETPIVEDPMAEQLEFSTIEDAFSRSIVEPLPAIESESAPSLAEEEISDNQMTAEQLTETTVLSVDPIMAAETPESQIALATEPLAENELMVATDDQLFNGETETISGNAVFIMQFEQDCWVEVTNSDTEKVVNRMAVAGDVIELTEKWPLLILLGNAAAVTATYNNEAFDISAHSNGNVARFSVGDPTE